MIIKLLCIYFTLFFIICIRDITEAVRIETNGISSNGTLIQLNDTETDLSVIKMSSPARLRRASTTGLVNIARFTDSSAAGKIHIAYVDNTIARLIFQVAVDRSNPVIIATTPSGLPSSVHPVLNGSASTGTVIATMDIPITAADYGFWKFTKMDTSTWDVSIKCDSPVYITQQLYDISTGTPVNNYPILGQNYRVEVTVTGHTNIQSVDFGFLFTRSKISPIAMVPLVSKGSGVYEGASVKIPNQVFMVAVQGKDTANHQFRRLDDKEITPVTLKLEVSPPTGATMCEYSTFNISFTVTNLLSTEQDVDIRISDDRGYAQAPKYLSATLKVGENFTGNFVLKATFAGLTTEATIKARQYLGSGQFTPGPTEIRNVTVIKNVTTTTSTSSTSTTSTTTSTTPPSTSSTITSSTSSTTSTSKPITSTPATVPTLKSTTSANAAATTKSPFVVFTLIPPTNSSTAPSSSSVFSLAQTSKPTSVSTSKTGTTQFGKIATMLSGKIASSTSATISTTSSAATTALPGGTTATSKQAPNIATTTSPIATNAPIGQGGSGSGASTPQSSSTKSTSTAVKSNTVSGSNSNNNSNNDGSSTSLEISAGVVVASMVTGTIVGIAAIATMSIVFHKALNRKDQRRVAPDDESRESISRERSLQWT